jgi:hypothetical protein
MEDRSQLLPLGAMARIVHVPTKWLREQAKAGSIPSLDAGGALLFHAPTVQKILTARAQAPKEKEPANA